MEVPRDNKNSILARLLGKRDEIKLDVVRSRMAKKDRTKEGRSESTKKHVLSIQTKEFFLKK